MKSLWALGWVLMLGVVVTTASRPCLAAPANASVGATLEKGYYQEKTAGDLDAAIATYEQVAADPNASKADAAEATYRIGLCQLKKGSDQAKQSFQKVIDEFPDQPAARKAKEQLQKLDAKRSEAPVVLSTTPVAFANDVPADLDKITVTFSQPMRDGSWSWTGGGETYPKTPGKPHYNADKTVCTLPVKLEPGKVYWVGINSPSYQNFKSPAGKPAGRYVILFATRSADGKPTPIPQDLLNRVRRINEASAADSQPSMQLPSVVTANSPVVVRTSPAAFTEDVPADLDKITVNFNQPMKDPAWAYIKEEADYPKVNGNPSYDASKTLYTLPVTLEPGKVYWVGINGPQWSAFRAADMTPAKPYVILFATRSTDGKPTPIPASLVQKAKAINNAPVGSDLTGMLRSPLQVGPAPWVDGERMALRMVMPTGMEIGTLTYTARAVEITGRPAWRIEGNQVITMAHMLQYTRVDAERESFRPILGVTKSAMGEFKADYAAENVTLKIRGTDGQEKTQQTPLQEPVFDNEQALYLIRRMPLAEDYSTKFMIFTVQGGSIVECDIDVLGRETVQAPAGTFDCWKVRLAIKVGQVTGLTHTLWFSADEHKYLVKYDAGPAVMELVEAKVQKVQPTTWKSQGMSIQLPAGWDVYEHATSTSGYKKTVQLLPPGQRAWGVLITAAPEMPPGVDTPRKVAEADIGTLTGFFKNYAVRQDSWKESTISGLPAASYAADYTDKGRSMVEYRTYLLGKEVYWFVFRVEKDEFEGLRSEMDAVIQSLQTEVVKRTGITP